MNPAFWSGWILFAGITMLLIGSYNLLRGLAAIVGLNAVAQAAFLSAFPLWSILVVALCILVLFALAARWDVAQADMTGTVSGGS